VDRDSNSQMVPSSETPNSMAENDKEKSKDYIAFENHKMKRNKHTPWLQYASGEEQQDFLP